MSDETKPLRAPFPYFGGKRLAASAIWSAIGDPPAYIEPFAGSAAVLLSRPTEPKTETINDADGFVCNFWRAVSADPDGVARYADWPCIESDLEARHAWLVNRSDRLRWQLEDPDFYDVKIAGWWVWGLCSWIGSGWCSGDGPHISNGVNIMNSRQLPHLSGGRGISRRLPEIFSGRGINRKLPHLSGGQGNRFEFIKNWMGTLSARLREVRVTCGDWKRITGHSATTLNGMTGVFLDPPYTKGKMDYAAGGVGGEIATSVREWCKENGDNALMRIVLAGHAGEHDELVEYGWRTVKWKARKGYALSDEAKANTASETLWCSPHCLGNKEESTPDLFPHQEESL